MKTSKYEIPLGTLTEIFDEVCINLFNGQSVVEDFCITTDKGQVTLNLREVLTIDPNVFEVIVKNKFIKKEE